MRLLTLMVLAFFALRTLLAWQADQLRMKDADDGQAEERGAEFKGLM